MIIATAGHVDHGKTTLVKALTGIDTDTLAEEKRRGLTITSGFAYCDMGSARIGFVDVPGHHQFVHNMLSGVTGIDAVLLVIAADEGIMPQTIEHVRIMELLSVQNALLVVSRIDRADPEILAILKSELETFSRDTCLEHAPIIHTCAPNGEGIDELRRRIADIASGLSARGVDGHFRMAIDRSFVLKGIGVIVTGFVHAGQIHTNDELILAPDERPVRVRGIFSDDQPATSASAGHRCAVNLGGVELAETRPGQWLTSKDASFGTRRVDVRLTVAADTPGPLKHWAPVHIFHGASHVTGRVALIEDRAVTPGNSQLAQLVLDDPIVAVHGDVCILRNQAADETLAGAMVLDVFATARNARRPARISLLRRMEGLQPEDCLRALVSEARDGADLEQFRLNRNLTTTQAQEIYGRIELVQIDTEAGIRGFGPDRWRQLLGDIQRFIADWNESRPETAGIRLDELRDALDPLLRNSFIKAGLDALIQRGEVMQTGRAYHLPDFRPALAEEHGPLWKIVYAKLNEPGNRPPTLEELSESCDIAVEATRKLLKQAEIMKLVVQLEPNRFILPGTLLGLAHALADLARTSADGRVTTAAYRDQSGLGRNLTISILEHFDAIQLTRRVGNSRCLIKPVDVVFESQGLLDQPQQQ